MKRSSVPETSRIVSANSMSPAGRSRYDDINDLPVAERLPEEESNAQNNSDNGYQLAQFRLDSKGAKIPSQTVPSILCVSNFSGVLKNPDVNDPLEKLGVSISTTVWMGKKVPRVRLVNCDGSNCDTPFYLILEGGKKFYLDKQVQAHFTRDSTPFILSTPEHMYLYMFVNKDSPKVASKADTRF